MSKKKSKRKHRANCDNDLYFPFNNQKEMKDDFEYCYTLLLGHNLLSMSADVELVWEELQRYLIKKYNDEIEAELRFDSITHILTQMADKSPIDYENTDIDTRRSI
ncbi:hypothetical protein [Vibrio maritimus]|uniref:hypothetical protein n=1 Tax=Vibrio maritimus TaxID=990268 RepID=UPI001F2ABAB7|nr:hypothetical protein [Vibrio maritimus]